MANDVATSLPALDYDKAFTLTVSVDDPAAVVSEIVVYGVMLNEAGDEGRVLADVEPLFTPLPVGGSS